MGSQLGPRIPQSTSTLVLVDPLNSRGITNTYTNLVSDPENMAGWTPVNAASVVSNTILAPDGTLTADTVLDNNTNTVHYISKWNIPVTAGLPYTVSVFAKAGTLNQILINTNILGGRNFDLVNGTSSTTGNDPSSWTITPVNDRWYRISITKVAPSSNLEIYFQSLINNSTGNGYYYLWGAQLTATSTLQEYIPQSNINNANRTSVIVNPLSTTNTTVSTVGNIVQGQVEYTTPGTYIWQCPPNVNSVNVVCVGGGGGGGYGSANGGSGAGGNLRYRNNIPVTPGQTYQVTVGSGGAAGTASTLNGQPGVLSSFGGFVIAQGGGAGTTIGGTTTTGGNIGTGSNGGPGAASDGGGGGAGGYVPTSLGGGVVQISSTQFDATSLGPVTSVDTIGAHPSATTMASSGFLKYTIARAAGNQQIVVSYRKTGTTISQSAWTVDGGSLNYTTGISSILFYLNDDHDTLWMDADGRGVISRNNNNNLNNAGGYDKFQGTTEFITNQLIDAVVTYPISSALGLNSTIVSFPLTNSSIMINLSSLTYKVNNGASTALPSPLSGIGTTAPTNSIITISDGVNQFLIYRYNTTNAYLCTVDLTTNTVSAVSVTVTSRALNPTNQTEEDAIGTQLFTVDGTLNWCENTIYYYGGTLDWKTNTNPFNTSGKLTFTAGTVNTQTDLDIWGSIDTTGYLWFADWGHDDGGLFNQGNDSQLSTRQTNIRYAPNFVSGDFVGVGGGIGGSLSGTAPGVGIGGGGGGGGGGSGGAGGGGVGIYGVGTNGSAGVTKAALTNGIQQGGGGSGGTGGLVKNSGTDLTAQTGGLYGGGGGAGYNGGPGGGGAVRIIWGPNRSFPSVAADVTTGTGADAVLNKLEAVTSLNSVTYNSGYLEFAGTTSSYASISNVPTSDYISVSAAIFLSNWTTATGTFISNADTDGTTRYQMGINNAGYSGSIGAIFNTRTGNVTVSFSRAGISSGWHILTATYDGTTARLYLDGVQVGTGSNSTTTVLNNVGFNTLTLGAKLTGTAVSEVIACRIGYLSIAEQAYSASEAQTIYANIRGRYGI